MCWFNKNKKIIAELELQNQELQKQLNINEEQITEEYIKSLGGYEFVTFSGDYYARKEYYMQDAIIAIKIHFNDRCIIVSDIKTKNPCYFSISNYYKGKPCFTKSNLQNIIKTINDLIDGV